MTPNVRTENGLFDRYYTYINIRRVKTLFSTSFRGEIHDEHRRNVGVHREVHVLAINVNGLDAVQHRGNGGGATTKSQCRCCSDNAASSELRRCCRRAPGKGAARAREDSQCTNKNGAYTLLRSLAYSRTQTSRQWRGCGRRGFPRVPTPLQLAAIACALQHPSEPPALCGCRKAAKPSGFIW